VLPESDGTYRVPVKASPLHRSANENRLLKQVTWHLPTRPQFHLRHRFSYRSGLANQPAGLGTCHYRAEQEDNRLAWNFSAQRFRVDAESPLIFAA
jgi:hypothetical protein